MFDDELYKESVAVHLDLDDDGDSDGPSGSPASVEILGMGAGPAGTSAVEFPDGTVWEVDHARPAQLVQISGVDLPLSGSPLVTEVLGADRVHEFDQRPKPTDGKAMIIPRAEQNPEPYVSAPRTSLQRQSTRSAAASTGRRIVAADLCGNEQLPAIVRIASGVEFVISVSTDGRFELLSPIIESLGSSLADLADTVADDDLAEFVAADRVLVDELDAYLGRVTAGRSIRRLGTLIGASLVRLRRRLANLSGEFDDATAVRFASLQAPPMLRSSTRLSAEFPADGVMYDMAAADFDADVVERPLGPEDFLEAEIERPGLLAVRVARGDSDRWVRVMRREGLTTIALAPLVRDGLLDRAELAVPPDVIPDDLVVRIQSAKEACGALAGADAIRAALAAGRDATHQERLGNWAAARDRWLDCAGLWRACGDEHRSGIARSYADEAARHGARPSRALPPLADRIAAVLARS